MNEQLYKNMNHLIKLIKYINFIDRQLRFVLIGHGFNLILALFNMFISSLSLAYTNVTIMFFLLGYFAYLVILSKKNFKEIDNIKIIINNTIMQEIDKIKLAIKKKY